MDKIWQKNLMYLLGLIAAGGAAFAYIHPSEPVRDPAFVPIGLEDKIDSVAADLKTMKVENNVRREARDKEVAGLKQHIDDKFLLLMDGINKLDTRLYEMNRRKSARAFGQEQEDGT